jgi:hypothetical protein
MSLKQLLFSSISDALMVFRIRPWYVIYCILTSPVFLILFAFFIRFFFFGYVDCLSYDERIYVVDSLRDPILNEFDSWLVHTKYLPDHLGLTQWEIGPYINSGVAIYSPEREQDLFISQCDLKSIDWSILITRHPEMVNPGYSCYTEYTLGIGNLGPRNSSDTLSEFLYTYCI